MAKAPTQKSRMIANAGVALIAVALTLDAWFSPPLPRLFIPLCGLIAVVLMQIAKQTRLSEGAEIPKAVLKSGASLANVEVTISLVDGLCVMAILGMEVAGAPRIYEQIATFGTLTLFVITVLTFRFTRTRFDALMVAEGVPLS